jgi:hypothetical protein
METEILAKLKDYLPLLIPVALLELGLMVAALIDIAKREKTKGPKWMWALIVIFFNLIGSIIYFIVGRDE